MTLGATLEMAMGHGHKALGLDFLDPTGLDRIWVRVHISRPKPCLDPIYIYTNKKNLNSKGSFGIIVSFQFLDFMILELYDISRYYKINLGHKDSN